MSTLVANFIAAGDTTIIAAGHALYAAAVADDTIPVRATDELEYYRAVRRFSAMGGGFANTATLLTLVEVE